MRRGLGSACRSFTWRELRCHNALFPSGYTLYCSSSGTTSALIASKLTGL